MLNQYSRLSMLIGEDKIQILHAKKVCVFGIGGVGGNCVEALIRSGIKHIAIVDNDEVSLTNLNRQLISTHKNIGKKKVDVMKERILDICPDCDVKVYDCFYLPDNHGGIELSNYDYVIDCIDTVSAKINIIEDCTRMNIPIISSMGTGNKLDPSKLMVTDIYKTEYDALAKVMRKELKKRGIKKLKVVYSREKGITPIMNEDAISELGHRRSIPGSSPFVPPVAGIMIASEVVRDLIK